MQIELSNEFYRIKIETLGAELQSVVGQHNDYEYLWQADPAVWGRHAPVLFPIVGKLKNDEYTYQGKTYHLTQHGFARDQEFAVERQTDHSITFLLKDSEASRAVYPFSFEFRVKYALINQLLKVTYYVTNPSSTEPLYFSVGGHPAFRVPLTDDLKFDDYFMRFKPSKSRIQIPLNPQGGIDFEHRTLAPTDVDWQVDHEIFKNDALIFQLNDENEIQILSDKTEHSVTLKTKDAPFLGIWSAYPKKGDYICLEPWWGIADSIDTSGELTEKKGINKLDPAGEFKAKYSINFK